jgi:2-aminoadipate transaminase
MQVKSGGNDSSSGDHARGKFSRHCLPGRVILWYCPALRMKLTAKTSPLSALGRRTAAPTISWLMATALARPNLISLAAGFTDNASLPVELAHQLLGEVLRHPQQGQAALQYGITTGENNLRELTARHLQKMDAGKDPTHTPDRLMISGGSQQLLYMTLEALCDEGDIILVEDPTYFVFLGILQSRAIQARGVRLDRDGIDLANLQAVLERLKKSGELRRVKALYLVTYFQNPTGASTSLAKKRKALALLKKYEAAAGHPLYLLEDAAYRELRFAGPDIPSALTLPGAASRVIYTGTYSKPFAPGIRLGFGILPEPLFTAVQRIKGNHDFGSANLLQQILAGALASGHYHTHVAKIEKRYGEKARVMKHALAEHFPVTVEIWESGGGLYFWARLPAGISAGLKSKVFQTALKNNVIYVPGELCYAEDPTRPKPDNEMRISFGTASEDNIREGIKRLGAVLKKFV